MCMLEWNVPSKLVSTCIQQIHMHTHLHTLPPHPSPPPPQQAFAEANRSDILLQDRRVQDSVVVAIEGYDATMMPVLWTHKYTSLYV